MLLFSKMTQKVLTVGTTQVNMPSIVQGDEVQNPEAIFVQCKDSNTGKVFIGKDGVQTDDSTGAFVFSAGDNGIIPFVKDEAMKLKANAAGQIVYITYLGN